MKQEVLQLTGGNNDNSRRKLDYYPTPRNVTAALMDFLNLSPRIIWEPACGNYAMSSVIKEYGHTVIETDIIYGQDYLQTFEKCDAIITNPPFNLSEKFIIKAVGEARIVALLLKSQYWHAAKRASIFAKYPPSHVLPLTWRPDFLEHERENGQKGAPTMEVAWNVWNKNASHETIYHPLLKPHSRNPLDHYP